MDMEIKILAFVVFFACALLSLCGRSEAAAVGAPEDMTELSMSKYGMYHGDPHHFSLQEADGKVLFSFGFLADHPITFENVPVAHEQMQRLREIVKKYRFTRMNERSTFGRPHIVDAPSYLMEMYWPDGKNLRLNYWPDSGGELEKFFWELAEACVVKPGAPEEISTLHYTYVHDDRSDSFGFSLREHEGTFLFSARCFTEDGEKVTFSRVPVSRTDVQRLREIVKEHGIVDMERRPLWNAPPRPPSPYTMLDLYWPDMRFVNLIDIESGAEELEQFFRDLVQANAEHWDPTHVPELLSWLDFIHHGDGEADSFSFSLREVGGATQLHARCVTGKGEKLDFYENVDSKYMDELRGIVRKHNLVPIVKQKKKNGTEYEGSHSSRLAMRWWEDPELYMTGWPDGGEELEKFFRALAEKYKD